MELKILQSISLPLGHIPLHFMLREEGFKDITGKACLDICWQMNQRGPSAHTTVLEVVEANAEEVLSQTGVGHRLQGARVGVFFHTASRAAQRALERSWK